MKVLHIVPHLGGGIGKAYAEVTRYLPSTIRQTFCLLETPIKKQYANQLMAMDVPVITSEGLDHVARLAGEHDIVQFGFITHPRVLECFACTAFPAMRSVIWSHISGLCVPYIPPGLITEVHRFVFSSNASLYGPVTKLIVGHEDKISVINSGYVFNDAPYKVPSLVTDNIRIGYMGTVSFAKMNPCFFDAIDALTDNVQALLWGDIDQQVVDYARSKKHPDRFRFCGHTTEPIKALTGVDLFFYPLQPFHYGTGENVLVEAMSLGLAPIVMDNLAEREIIKHLETGMLCDDTADCIRRLKQLTKLPNIRRRLGARARKYVLETRHPSQAATDFVLLWRKMMALEPAKNDFAGVLGTTPADWYLATQKLPGVPAEGPALAGATKGSLAHYAKIFAGDDSLQALGV